jgi:hypothetical protein
MLGGTGNVIREGSLVGCFIDSTINRRAVLSNYYLRVMGVLLLRAPFPALSFTHPKSVLSLTIAVRL